MSGGSFNYLYIKDASEIMNNMSDLNSMVDELDMLFPNSRAYLDAQHLLNYVEAARKEIDRRMGELSDVFHAVEWYRSCDSGIERVNQSVSEYDQKHSR